jgi:hypothetical protein
MKAILRNAIVCLAVAAGIVASAGACSSSATAAGGFGGTYTGTLSLQAMSAADTETGTTKQTWTLTEDGEIVSFNFAPCPGLDGTASGDVLTVNATDCPPISNGNITDYTGGTLTLSGDSLIVDMTVSVHAVGQTFVGALTGTMTRSTSPGEGSGSGTSSASGSGGCWPPPKSDPCGGGCHGCSTCTSSGCMSCPVGEEGDCTC